MYRILLLISVCLCLVATSLSAQTLEELKAEKAQLESIKSEAQARVDSCQAEINSLKKSIQLMSGWETGLNGMIGFQFNKSDNWISNPNKNATSTALNIALAAHANRNWEKAFWRNKLVLNKSWQDVDLDNEEEDDGLFDNATVDILNISSLAGYKLSEKFALTGLGELNSSIENFLDPGTLDFGVGGTWTPVENLVVVVHPFNYHIAFSGTANIDSQGSLGAKVRIDYTRTFVIGSKDVNWSSTFTSYVPYGDQTIPAMEGDESYDAELFEYTWINNLSFSIWKDIGVGVGFGLREAEYESRDLQSYYSLGISYKI